MSDPLALFSPPVAGWFNAHFGAPTRPQELGWPVIARSEHVLIVSPTGSGKTLTAFLWSLDHLFRELSLTPEPERATRAKNGYQPGIRVVYVSPLKALNNDVERNLQVPLAGIKAAARKDSRELPEIRVAVRTGDTPAAERQKMVRRPPQILITTPESLYLMLTSERARAIFGTTHTVIVDEIHTLVGTKRGAHLALSLERLDRVSQTRLQRIGLSATVRPLDHAARFLGGQDPRADLSPRPVQIVDASYPRPIDLRVVTPVEDFRDVPNNSVWTAIVPEVARLIDEHRTTLIFCNNRRLAERSADRLNEQRLLRAQGPDVFPPAHISAGPGDLGMFAAGVDERLLELAGLAVIRAHHGSMSKSARLDMERGLKSGTLPALVATSSLELGIDIGEIDLVVQLQSPKSVASGLQRIGRSGHLVGQTSVGRIFPSHVDDLIEAAAVCRGMLRREIEASVTPENPLDVLAQQLVAMVSVEAFTFEEAFSVVRGAFPFQQLSETAFRGVVEMLSGKYPESVSRYLKALISWDRLNNRLSALPGANVLAIGSGGTIPDRGTYGLVLSDRRTKVGDLDEEFVFESRPGDTFLLGSHVWRILEIADDRVLAEPAPGEVPRMPFWRGDAPWRPYELGRRIGAFRRELVDLVRGLTADDLAAIHALDDATIAALCDPPSGNREPLTPTLARGEKGPADRPFDGIVPVNKSDQSPLPTREGQGEGPLSNGKRGDSTASRSGLTPLARHVVQFLAGECALDRNSLVLAVDYVARQLEASGELATDRTIVVETFEDAIGEPRLVVHTPFGGRVNWPWAIVLAGAIRERYGVEVQIMSNDDGFLLRFASSDTAPPMDLVGKITSAEARERLLAELPNSATFVAQFRMNAARALLLPRERAGKRTPLWLSRLRAKDLLQAIQGFGDFPILLETFRDCLRDVMDLAGLTEVLDRIQRGEVEVVVHDAELPSPVALGLDYRFALQFVYEYDQPRGERQLAALSLNRELLGDLLRDGTLAGLLKPEAVAEVAARAGRATALDRIRDSEELAHTIYELGDLSSAEIHSRAPSENAAVWLESLVGAGRVVLWRSGDAERWIHAERRDEYARLAVDPAPILRRFLTHAGPTSVADLASRYDLSPDLTRSALVGLGDEVAAGQFVADGEEQWIDRHNLEQIHRRSLAILRKEVQPVPLFAYAEFLRRWQRVDGGPARPEPNEGGDLPSDSDSAELTRVLQQLRGYPIPGPLWERDVLPARVSGFDSALVAERCQSGDLMWVADGNKDPHRARVLFFFRGEGGIFLDRRPGDETIASLGEPARLVYEYLQSEGAALLADVAEGVELSRAETQAALVELVLAGLVTNDSLDALRSVLGYDPPAPRAAPPASTLETQLATLLANRQSPTRPLRGQRLRDARRRAREAVFVASRQQRTTWLGRWSLVHRPGLLGKALSPEERATRQARQLLTRWGVVTKLCLEREATALSWEALYPVLGRLETRGEIRRGYFVEGLPGIQFALPEGVEQLRQANRPIRPIDDDGMAAPAITVLGAADPAQLFGSDDYGGPLRFARLATTAVAALRGEPIAAMEDRGAAINADADHPSLVSALRALARWWAPRTNGRLRVERWNGESIGASGATPLLEAAGFVRDYGGMLWIG
jgi:ATP-dependent Lhr-like helicase